MRVLSSLPQARLLAKVWVLWAFSTMQEIMDSLLSSRRKDHNNNGTLKVNRCTVLWLPIC